MARNPVLRWAAEAQRAARKYGIPAAVLLGLIEVESGGDPNAVSSAGARGLTQFMPGTAPGYDVRYGSSAAATRSQIEGAARYLVALGWADDRRNALASYNAGPGNPDAAGSYPEKVMAAARKYGNLANIRLPGRSGRQSPQDAAGDSGGLFGSDEASGALRALLWVALLAAGFATAGIGLARLVGVRNPIGLIPAARAAGGAT